MTNFNNNFANPYESFKRLDESMAGSLTFNELRNRLFTDLEDNRFYEIISMLDLDKDGKISVEDWVRSNL